jgi:hypothetical protein
MKFVSVFTSDGTNLYCNSNEPYSIAGAAMELMVRHTRKGLVIKEKVFGGKNLAYSPVRATEFKRWIQMQEVKAADIFHLYDINSHTRYAMLVACEEPCQIRH